jgi:ABC-type multidrug transport system fused ATPase/permease subunit
MNPANGSGFLYFRTPQFARISMNNQNPLWRCLALYRLMPYRFCLTAALFVMVNISLAWQQWLVGRAVHDVEIGKAAIRLADGQFDLSVARYWLVFIIAVAAGRAIFQYAGGVMAMIIGQELLYVLRERILLQVQRLDLAYHWRHGVGEIVTRTTRDADKVRDALINFWRQVFEAALVLFAAVGLLCWYHPWLGFVPLLLTLAAISLFVWQTDRLVSLDRAVGAAYDRVNQDLSEGVNGVRVIKSFALEQRRIEIFNGHVERFMQQALIALRYSASRVPLPQVVVALGHVWILAFGAHLVQAGKMNVGELVASLLIANTIVFRVEGIGRVMQIFADARSSAARIWEFLDEKPAITSGRQSVPEGPLGVRVKAAQVTAAGGDTPILRDCDFEVSPGEVVAVVGATGSGKSTLASLLPRLLDAERGVVSIGSPWLGWHDVKELKLDELRRKVHVVPQESFLFSDTLAANLRIGTPDATESDMREALKMACATDALDRLADGFNARIGDRGITLSGGQRQRICLARALLAKPEVLVLDDATSALDALTERRVLENLRVARQNSHAPTVILITSKLSTILLADRVVMLASGSVLAEGQHHVLLDSSAAYRELLGDGNGE